MSNGDDVRKREQAERAAQAEREAQAQREAESVRRTLEEQRKQNPDAFDKKWS